MANYPHVARSLPAAVALAVLLALSGCGGGVPADPSDSATVEEVTSTPATPAPEPSESPADESTPTGAEPGTRENPLAAGSTLEIENLNGSGETNRAEIVIGAANWDARGLIEGASGEAVPAEGSIFVLVPVTVTLIEADTSDSIPGDYLFDLTYVTPDGRGFMPTVASYEDVFSRQPSLYPGASATGSIFYELPADGTGGTWAVRDWIQATEPRFVVAE